MRTKDTPTPWKQLDPWRGTEFVGEFPTIKEQMHISALRYPERPFLEVFSPKHYVMTFKEAERKIKDVSNWILAQGIEKGEKIIVSGKNSPEWACAYLAVQYAGGIVVPLDNNLLEEDFVKLAKFSDSTIILADSARLKSLPDLGFKAIACLEEKSDWTYIFDLNGPEKEGYKCTSEDIAAILFTSGTTGTPKGVMLTNHNIIGDTWLAQSLMNIYPEDVFYAILPIHHAYTMLAVFMEAMSSGAKIVFGKKLVVSQMLKELKEGGVTMFLAVPMLFNKLYAGILAGVKKKGKFVYGLIRCMMSISGFLKKVTGVNIGHKMFNFLLKQVSLDKVRICICGGGALPSSTFKGFNQLGIDFVQGYGLTETSPITHLNPIYAYEETSVGKNIAQVECKIVDPDAEGNGVIYIKGPMVMKGYYKNQEATDEVLTKDGWLNTGDVGHIDSKNYLYLTGRAKSIIVTEGGKNVFPEEIEDKFQLYTEIQQICIIGYMVDKKMKTEGIRAVIYPTADFVKSCGGDKAKVEKRMNEIVSEVNKPLQSYRKISMVTVTDEPLEVTSTQKIKRFAVAKKYAL